MVKNGLYPSFLPKLLYKEFLAMMVMADVANAPLSHNNLLRRYKHAERVNQAVARLDWCEHTDWADVQRVVRNLLRDLYCL